MNTEVIVLAGIAALPGVLVGLAAFVHVNHKIDKLLDIVMELVKLQHKQ